MQKRIPHKDEILEPGLHPTKTNKPPEGSNKTLIYLKKRNKTKQRKEMEDLAERGKSPRKLDRESTRRKERHRNAQTGYLKEGRGAFWDENFG